MNARLLVFLIFNLKFMLASCQPQKHDIQEVKPRHPVENAKAEESVIILPEMTRPADKSKAALSLQEMFAILPEYKGDYATVAPKSWFTALYLMRGVICLSGEKAHLETIPTLENKEKTPKSSTDEDFFQHLKQIAEHIEPLDPVLSQRIVSFVENFYKQTLLSDFPLTDLITQQNLGTVELQPHQKDCRIALGAINRSVMVSGNRYERYIWNPLWQKLNHSEKAQWALTWLVGDLGLVGVRNETNAEKFLSYIAKLQSKTFKESEWVEYASYIDSIDGVYLYPYGELWLNATAIKKSDDGLISGWTISPRSPPLVKLGSVLLEGINGTYSEESVISFKGGRIKTIESNEIYLSLILGNCKLKTRNVQWNLTFSDENYEWFSVNGDFKFDSCLVSLGITKKNGNSLSGEGVRIKKDQFGISFDEGISLKKDEIIPDLGLICPDESCSSILLSLYPSMKIKEVYFAESEIQTTDGKIYSNGDFIVTYDEAGKIIKIIGGR